MEKSGGKSKNSLLKFLPKAASAVAFQNHPFSPNKEKRSAESSTKLKTHIGKGFSGPMISLIPAEARYKSRTSSFATHEPTSPKISCMGQIKHRKKMCSQNKYTQDSLPPRDRSIISHSSRFELEHQVNYKNPKVLKSVQSFTEVKNKNPRVLKSVQSFRNIFRKSGSKKTDVSSVDAPHHRGPAGSGQMQRFSSRRNSLSNFDWTAAQIAPVEADHGRNYYSDEEREGVRKEEDVKITFSAPLVMDRCKSVNLEPRKEINLWKRRTMAQLKPLRVN